MTMQTCLNARSTRTVENWEGDHLGNGLDWKIGSWKRVVHGHEDKDVHKRCYFGDKDHRTSRGECEYSHMKPYFDSFRIPPRCLDAVAVGIDRSLQAEAPQMAEAGMAQVDEVLCWYWDGCSCSCCWERCCSSGPYGSNGGGRYDTSGSSYTKS